MFALVILRVEQLFGFPISPKDEVGWGDIGLCLEVQQIRINLPQSLLGLYFSVYFKHALSLFLGSSASPVPFPPGSLLLLPHLLQDYRT